MKSRSRILAGFGALYLAGLVGGYVRLPVAALNNLGDRRLIAGSAAVAFSPTMNVSPAQRWYLGLAFPEAPAPTRPVLHVDVQWNALVLARVTSGHATSGRAAERRDSVYLCLFGVWVPVYNFDRIIV